MTLGDQIHRLSRHCSAVSKCASRDGSVSKDDDLHPGLPESDSQDPHGERGERESTPPSCSPVSTPHTHTQYLKCHTILKASFSSRAVVAPTPTTPYKRLHHGLCRIPLFLIKNCPGNGSVVRALAAPPMISSLAKPCPALSYCLLWFPAPI